MNDNPCGHVLNVPHLHLEIMVRPWPDLHHSNAQKCQNNLTTLGLARVGYTSKILVTVIASFEQTYDLIINGSTRESLALTSLSRQLLCYALKHFIDPQQQCPAYILDTYKEESSSGCMYQVHI